MPSYRLGSGGTWRKISSVYRLGNNGVWKRISAIYRLGSNGVWRRIFSSLADTPAIVSAPTLRNPSGLDPIASNDSTLFYGGQTITLRRGSYSNTDSTTNTKYTMSIRKSINTATAIANWETVATQTFYGNNSTTNTSITYDLTDADGRGKYYFAGVIIINNNANVAGSQDSPPFVVTSNDTLAKISATVTGYQSFGVTSNGSQFSFTIGGITAGVGTDIYDIIIDILNPSDHPTSPNTVIVTKDDIGLVYGYITTSIFNNLIQPNTTNYQARLKVIFNDGWATSNYPTQIVQTINFTTLAANLPEPQPSISRPALSPLNARGSYVPAFSPKDALPAKGIFTSQAAIWTSTTGSWTNTPSSYTYELLKLDANVGEYVSISGYPTQSSNTWNAGSDLVGSTVKVRVLATNANGTSLTANESISYSVDTAPWVSTFYSNIVGTGNVYAGRARNFTFNTKNWTTSFIVDWGDGTTYSSGNLTGHDAAGNLSTIVSKTYTASGTYTMTITVQPTNFSQNLVGNLTVYDLPVAPTLTSVLLQGTTSNAIAYVNFSGTGIGPYYQMFWNNFTIGGTLISPSNSSTYYDAATTSSTVISDNISTAYVDQDYYFWVRSSSQNIAFTYDGGEATAGTFGDWSVPIKYTTKAPNFTVSISPSSATAGTTFTASILDEVGNPPPSQNGQSGYTYQWSYFTGLGFTTITGANSGTFDSTEYGGYTIRCIIVGTNMFGSGTASSTANVTSTPVITTTTTTTTSTATTTTTTTTTTAAPSANFTAGPGTTSCPAGSTVLAQGTFTPSFTGQTIVINTGAACGTQSVYIYTSGMQWSWKCCSA